MRCQYCKVLDFDQACGEGVAHHESYTDLLKSADEGCELCAFVRDNKLPDPQGSEERDSEAGRIFCDHLNYSSLLVWRRGSRRYGTDMITTAAIWTTDDDPMGKLIDMRGIPSDARSADSMSRTKSWLTICKRDHKECLQKVACHLPTRVIDVGNSETPPSLLETGDQTGQWLALSYCWGDAPPLRTEKSSLKAFCKQFPTLPLLFQDAVSVVKQIGYQYLWIDALCIVQDSEQDWLNESAHMGQIFGDAALVIIAEAAKDSSTSLFDSTNEGRHCSEIAIPAYSSEHGAKGYVMLGPPRKWNIQSKGSVSDRAWVFQEEVLSVRKLRFATGQIWWQCRTSQKSEGVPHGTSSENRREREWAFDGSFRSPSKAWNVQNRPIDLDDRQGRAKKGWYWSVNEYSRRRITYEKDLLPAISGIAKEYCRYLDQDYKAGLWSRDMHLGLLWRSPVPEACKTKTYVAPSWSWATLRLPPKLPVYSKSRNIYDSELFDPELGYCPPLRPMADIRSVHITPMRQDVFGQVRFGSLNIVGPCYEVCRCTMPVSFFDCYQLDGSQSPLSSCTTLGKLFRVLFSGENPLDESWTTEQVMKKKCHQGNSNTVHGECVLLHIASRSGDLDNYVFALILETVPLNEECELQRTSSSGTSKPCEKHYHRPPNSVAQRPETSVANSEERNAAKDGHDRAEKSLPYRRIGLAIFQETWFSPEWPTRTFTII